MAFSIHGLNLCTRLCLSAFGGLLASLAATEAHADLKLCNRMSYVIDTAIAIEDRGQASVRGWYRVDPGQCRSAIQGPLPAGDFYLHVRVPQLYGSAPVPQRSDGEFCIATDNFSNSNARNCRGSQRNAAFTAVKPVAIEQGHAITLAEEAGYDPDQARDAGIQRLLAVAGYDAGPIDGVRSDKTEMAIRQFTADNKLGITAAGRADFFTNLMDAAQKPGNGFAWCNDSAHAVMAAIGIEEGNAVTTRGWYRVEPGRCLRPDITGTPNRVFSFAEAVDSSGRTLASDGKPLAWGGTATLCTRPARFEIYDHLDCSAQGLTQTGFATIEFKGAATIRFK
jgi:uncharacterized membrane protein